jgi:Putative arginyl-tRNA:protein arginylyltransferase
MNRETHKLGFFITPAHACSYLERRQATTLFVDPELPLDRHVYSSLLRRGFRRSGEYLYKPHCSDCNACVPVRIPVNEFSARRSQQRTWRYNQDLIIIAQPPAFKQEHHELYRRYIAARHPGGGMDDPDPGTYMAFLTSSWMETVFYEMRLRERLLAVAVVDHLDDGLSAVYTFYDPEETRRTLGTFAILFEINETRRLGKEWLYLGYWIKGCAKMDYKNVFQPLEYFHHNTWARNP